MGMGWLAHRPVKMLFIGSQGLEADTQGWSWGSRVLGLADVDGGPTSH